MAKDTRPAAWGPTWIPSKQRWRVLVLTPSEDGTSRRRSARWFDEEEAASDFKEAIDLKLNKFSRVTLEDAIDQYEQHLRETGTLPVSYRETCRRLRIFFPSLALAVSRVTPDRAQLYYEKFRRRLKPNGEPISVDYHRAALINARSFCKWCIAQGWLALNPFEAVEGIGRRSAGKPQLTGDEIRRLYAHCIDRAKTGDASALGILMALLMALRSSDLTRRVVRDLDLDGTVLRVQAGKTRKSNRPRTVPEVLRPALRQLVVGREADAPLFWTPYTTSGHHTRRWLEQAMERHCEAAGVPYVPPHSLKGAAGTILAETGELADRIADHLSHESPATTQRHYIADGAVEDARQRKALKVISGGRK